MIIKLLNENFNNIAYLPKNQLDAFNNIYRDYYKNYNIEKVKISDLLRDDPGLNDNDDLGSYHEIIWGDDVNKYKYDPSKNNRGSEVPSVVYKNGKYHISDGRHRIKALANSGYEYIELPVLREMLLEDNDDNNSGEEEIKLTSHLNYPDMVYDYVFRVSWGKDTLMARFTKRDCKDNVAGYPFTAAWTSLNLKGGSQLSFLTSADVEEFLSKNVFRGTNIYVSKSKQKVVRIDVNGKVPCYVGVDYLNSTYGDKEGYIHPVIQKRLDEATPTANTVTIKCADGTIITPSSRTETTTATDEELFNNKKTVSEAMTKKEVLFKRNVLQYLLEEGFPTFAKYLKNFHFNFLTSEEAGKPFVAAISSARGIVLVNPNVDADAISMLLRHEAGHDIFKHNEHLFAKLKKMGIDTPSELAHDLANRAGDYHISNLLYDEDDYYTAKHINVDGEVLAGLVTELDFPDHPEYWTMDFDQLWDVFVKNYSRDDLTKKALDDNSEEDNKLSDDYVEGYNRLIDDYNAGKITKEQISRWLNAQGK